MSESRLADRHRKSKAYPWEIAARRAPFEGDSVASVAGVGSPVPAAGRYIVDESTSGTRGLTTGTAGPSRNPPHPRRSPW